MVALVGILCWLAALEHGVTSAAHRYGGTVELNSHRKFLNPNASHTKEEMLCPSVLELRMLWLLSHKVCNTRLILDVFNFVIELL